MSSFRVGQKVVCIDDDWPFKDDPRMRRVPMIGEVLTIIDTSNYVFSNGPDVTLAFAELQENFLWDDGRYGMTYYASQFFRPLIERPESLEHDTELFLSLLTNRELVE